MIDFGLLQEAVRADSYWSAYLRSSGERQAIRMHLAIFVEPFLGFVLDGSKTIESRFSVNATAPYGRVSRGDVVLLKRSGGPICGICQAANVWYYELDKRAWREIRRRFATALRLDAPDLKDRCNRASYATLIRLKHVSPTLPIGVAKRDRRGWVVLTELNHLLNLFEYSECRQAIRYSR